MFIDGPVDSDRMQSSLSGCDLYTHRELKYSSIIGKGCCNGRKVPLVSYQLRIISWMVSILIVFFSKCCRIGCSSLNLETRHQISK